MFTKYLFIEYNFRKTHKRHLYWQGISMQLQKSTGDLDKNIMEVPYWIARQRNNIPFTVPFK